MILPLGLTSEQMERLTSLLGQEEALLSLRRSQLDSLCAAIVDRDDDAVERLLEQVEQAQQLHANTDEKLNALRRELAEQLACPIERVRVSALIDELDSPEREALARQRDRIVELAEALQLQHLRTVMLLSECARINRLLLESLFPKSEGVLTYTASGQDPWQPDAGLFDAER